MTLAETAAAGYEMGTGHQAEITRSHYAAGFNAGLRAAALLARDFTENYPPDIFIPGGISVDAQSADVIRHMAPVIASEIEKEIQ